MHSHNTHLYALLETAKELEVPNVYIHFLGDGRDTAPRSSAKYAKELLDFIEKEKVGKLVTIIGRYYAMDRDKRWERVKIAAEGLVKGEGEASDDPIATIEARYKKDETDEFLKPIIIGGDEGRIKGVDDVALVSSQRTDSLQRVTPFSFSTIALTGCERSPPSSENSMMLLILKSRRIWCAFFS